MTKEIELQKEYLSAKILDTVYFGGGTPSLLNEEEMNLLWDAIHRHFDIAQDAEVTLEANPEDLTLDKIQLFRSTGINRLSIGIQSFDNQLLTFLNRNHNAQMAVGAVLLAAETGFENLNIDLIYGIPGSSLKSWRQDLEKALDLPVQHISSYSLTIEEKTVFGKWHKQKRFQAMDEELMVTQFQLMVDLLYSKGFEQYEISNFALYEKYARHNSNYWLNRPYLGIGPGAHSFNLSERQYNIENNGIYIRKLKENSIPYEKEILSREQKINEYLLTGLRTKWGCDLILLKNKFDFDLLKEKYQALKRLEKARWLEIKDQRLFLTQAGKLLADEITLELTLDV